MLKIRKLAALSLAQSRCRWSANRMAPWCAGTPRAAPNALRHLSSSASDANSKPPADATFNPRWWEQIVSSTSQDAAKPTQPLETEFKINGSFSMPVEAPRDPVPVPEGTENAEAAPVKNPVQFFRGPGEADPSAPATSTSDAPSSSSSATSASEPKVMQTEIGAAVLSQAREAAASASLSPLATHLRERHTTESLRSLSDHYDFLFPDQSHAVIDHGTLCMEVLPPPFKTAVPELANDLKDVPLIPGIHQTHRFDKYFEKIVQPEQIDFNQIPPFVTSSRDPMLHDLARTHHANIVGSTSSTTGILSQFHFLLSGFKPHNMSAFSPAFGLLNSNFSASSVKPAVVMLRKREDFWGVDSQPQSAPYPNQILIDLGKSMERMLTMEPQQFMDSMVLMDGVDRPPIGDVREPYLFVLVNNKVILRSQLDCISHDAPRVNKVFDLKTRATLPIRLDVENHKRYLEYRVTKERGIFHSFEREWWDMARSAFLKYSFQCRIGQMGGIMVAYHNTEEVFGMEYISLEQMDAITYGSTAYANKVYELSLILFEKVINNVTSRHTNEKGVQVSFQTVRSASARRMSQTQQETGEVPERRLKVYVECVPSEEDDPCRFKPFHERHSSLMKVDSMSDEEIRHELSLLGLDTEGSRPAIASRLEGTLAPRKDTEMPPFDYYLHLAEKGYLNQYELAVTITKNGLPLEGPLMYQPGDHIQVDYSFDKVQPSTEELAQHYMELQQDSRRLTTNGPGSLMRGIPMNEAQASAMEARLRNAQQASIEAKRKAEERQRALLQHKLNSELDGQSSSQSSEAQAKAASSSATPAPAPRAHYTR